MATRFLTKKTHRFHFVNEKGKDASYVLIFGDEVDTMGGAAPSRGDYRKVRYRGRVGEWVPPPLTSKRPLEFYFLDVGQGDAAFVVTPGGKKILIDGGLKELALSFLVWKYRLDKPDGAVTIDHLFLTHADKDHVEGLIPVLTHPLVTVSHIHHNGIGLFDSGFNTPIGNKASTRLTTLHDTLDDLAGLDLASSSQAVFKEWIDAVRSSGASYRRLDQSQGVLEIGDDDIKIEITGPVLEPDGSLKWLTDKSHTINGHSLTFRLIHNRVRAFFSGDLNERGSEYLLDAPGGPLRVNAHIFKAPHHGSHDYSDDLLAAVNPQITVVSSGEVPDHGHPRANFLASIGRASRGLEPLVFSTELSALFVDAHDPEAVAQADEGGNPRDIDFAASQAAQMRQNFKKALPGIINVRSDGENLYAFRRVQQGYQWESYGPIKAAV